jgi:hypothetical protein
MEIETMRGADGRRKPDGERQYKIKEIWDAHQEIIRRLALGQSGADICRDLGVTAPMISYVRNSPLGQEALRKIHSLANEDVVNVSKRIRSITPKAVQVLEQILDDAIAVPPNLPADKKTVSSVAFGILDRGGHAPVHKSISVGVPVGNDTIEEIKNRARQAGIVIAEVNEREVEEVSNDEDSDNEDSG